MNDDSVSMFILGFIIGGIIVLFACLHDTTKTEECKNTDGIEVCRTIRYSDWEVK